MARRKRILTGDRPTGPLHIGHYVGTLANRVALQDSHECFFIIADVHTLTTRPEKNYLDALSSTIREVILDYLSVGIDPERSTVFVQSAIPETFELTTLLGMLVNVPRLERVPTLKEMAQDAQLDTMPFGLLGYPVLQAADILLPRADLVPIGKDNESHLEVTREICRRFNKLYGEVFPEPDTLLGDVPSLLGTDGQAKMSSSIGNTILLSDDQDTVDRQVMRMYTDPKRVRADVPGTVEGNPVFQYHDAFNPDRAEVDDLKDRYRRGAVGDVEVKKSLAAALDAFLTPIRERRAELAADEKHLVEIVDAGNERMQKEARETMTLVRDAMGLGARGFARP